MMPDAIRVVFDPALDPPWLIALGLVALVPVIWGLYQRARGMLWRGLGLLVLLAILANPTLIAEERAPKGDIVVLAVDRSPSQEIGDRAATTDKAVEHVRASLEAMKDVELREISVKTGRIESGGGTRMMSEITRSLADIPADRLGAVVVISDGQIHDADEIEDKTVVKAPLHALLTGTRDEVDRRIVVDRAPSYGMVGRKATVTIKVEDPAMPDQSPVPVVIKVDGEIRATVPVPVNWLQDIEIELTHGGQSVIELEVAAGDRELTLENNRAVLAINGVRDRLRVLLVSGAPHAGERTWRNLLKADPSVDLVHFTILRPPEKQDNTPIRELSLIAFPVRELFVLKLDEFDLIIFDRYRWRGVLPRPYLKNIADYVRKGGALLEASGPSFASRLSLFRTPLGELLPGRPTGVIFEQGFTPNLSPLGERHPVTANLPGHGEDGASWGRWFRQIEAEQARGSVLMNGIDGKPLLLLDRVGKGRVAHLLSDHIWLWSRGYEGGGPQAELLRRTAHWLMGEPELEEEDLRAVVEGERMQLIRRSLDDELTTTTVTGPDGSERRIELQAEGPGRATSTIETDSPGLYRISDGKLSTMAVVGDLNPLETIDVRATEISLRPFIQASGGSTNWVADKGLPRIRRVRSGRASNGQGWIGVRENGAFEVTGLLSMPLLPALLALALVLATVLTAWRREGH